MPAIMSKTFTAVSFCISVQIDRAVKASQAMHAPVSGACMMPSAGMQESALHYIEQADTDVGIPSHGKGSTNAFVSSAAARNRAYGKAENR